MASQAWSAYRLNEAEAGAEVPRHDAHALKLWLMVGRCDGWMGLLRGR